MADKRLLVVETEFASVLAHGSRGQHAQPGDPAVLGGRRPQDDDEGESGDGDRGAHLDRCPHHRGRAAPEAVCDRRVNGFANRFLWVCAKRSKSLPRGGRQIEWRDSREVEDLRTAIRFARAETRRRLRRRGRRAVGPGVRPVGHRPDGAARGGHQPGAGTDPSASHLYALLDCRSVIELVHLRAALEVWRYCEDSCRYLFGDRTGNPIADTLIEGSASAAARG